MCRFAVRNGQAASASPKLEAPPINLDALFAQGNEELDASDMALLALFSGAAPAPGAEDGPLQPASAGSSAGSPLDASCNTVVMGQAMTAPATQQAAVAGAGLLPTPPANPVQQLQFQAVLQHQAAIMQNPGTYPAAAQMYQQAMLQTGGLASQPSGALTYSGSLRTAAAPAAGPAPALLGKRGKSQEEIEEQTERIKKRRRESAQRSRQRKNAYMKSLEMENRALKLENERLRVELSKSTGAPLAPAPVAAPKASSASVSRSEASLGADDSEHGSGHDEDGGLCNPLMGLDPLALMPTADLLSFAF
jgi:regulator of replication initiation timing